MSVKFLSAILGPEMAAPILWTPGKMPFPAGKPRGGVFWDLGGGGGSADFIFMGARIFLRLVAFLIYLSDVAFDGLRQQRQRSMVPESRVPQSAETRVVCTARGGEQLCENIAVRIVVQQRSASQTGTKLALVAPLCSHMSMTSETKWETQPYPSGDVLANSSDIRPAPPVPYRSRSCGKSQVTRTEAESVTQELELLKGVYKMASISLKTDVLKTCHCQ